VFVDDGFNLKILHEGLALTNEFGTFAYTPVFNGFTVYGHKVPDERGLALSKHDKQ
jgi:hypothetical protein